MSDTAIAIIILPILVALTLLLECTRIGCTRLSRKLKQTKLPHAGMQSHHLQS